MHHCYALKHDHQRFCDHLRRINDEDDDDDNDDRCDDDDSRLDPYFCRSVSENWWSVYFVVSGTTGTQGHTKTDRRASSSSSIISSSSILVFVHHLEFPLQKMQQKHSSL